MFWCLRGWKRRLEQLLPRCSSFPLLSIFLALFSLYFTSLSNICSWLLCVLEICVCAGEMVDLVVKRVGLNFNHCKGKRRKAKDWVLGFSKEVISVGVGVETKGEFRRLCCRSYFSFSM